MDARYGYKVYFCHRKIGKICYLIGIQNDSMIWTSGKKDRPAACRGA